MRATRRFQAGGIACTVTCSRASANEPCPGGQEAVIVFHAGSLANAFTPLEQAFVCRTGIHVIDCRGGSLDLARALTAGGYAADLYAPADYLDIDLFLKPGGYAEYNILFAEGKMVLTYTTRSTGAEDSRAWRFQSSGLHSGRGGGLWEGRHGGAGIVLVLDPDAARRGHRDWASVPRPGRVPESHGI